MKSQPKYSISALPSALVRELVDEKGGKGEFGSL